MAFLEIEVCSGGGLSCDFRAIIFHVALTLLSLRRRCYGIHGTVVGMGVVHDLDQVGV